MRKKLLLIGLVLVIFLNTIQVFGYQLEDITLNTGGDKIVNPRNFYHLSYGGKDFYFIGLPNGAHDVLLYIYVYNGTHLIRLAQTGLTSSITGDARTNNLGIIGYYVHNDLLYMVNAHMGTYRNTNYYDRFGIDIKALNLTELVNGNVVIYDKMSLSPGDLYVSPSSSVPYVDKSMGSAYGYNGLIDIFVWGKFRTYDYIYHAIYDVTTNSLVTSAHVGDGINPSYIHQHAYGNYYFTFAGNKVFVYNVTGNVFTSSTITVPYTILSKDYVSMTSTSSGNEVDFGFPVIQTISTNGYTVRAFITMNNNTHFSQYYVDIAYNPSPSSTTITTYYTHDASSGQFVGNGLNSIYIFQDTVGTFRTFISNGVISSQPSINNTVTKYYVLGEFTPDNNIFYPFYSTISGTNIKIYENFANLVTNSGYVNTTAGGYTQTITQTMTITYNVTTTTTVTNGVTVTQNVTNYAIVSGNQTVYSWNVTVTNPYPKTVTVTMPDSTTLTDIKNFMLPLLLMLTPAFLLASGGMGIAGIFLGLTIGIGVGVATGVIPFWFIVLLALALFLVIRQRLGV